MKQNVLLTISELVIYLADTTIRNIDQRWRKEISRAELLARLQHLDPMSQTKWQYLLQ